MKELAYAHITEPLLCAGADWLGSILEHYFCHENPAAWNHLKQVLSHLTVGWRRKDTPDLTWLLNLLLSLLCASFSLFSCIIIFPAHSVSLFLTRCHFGEKKELTVMSGLGLYVCECGDRVRPFLTPGCMREPDSVWSDHWSHSRGLRQQQFNLSYFMFLYVFLH